MKISIITPIYNTPIQYLESYFEVLNNQIHISDSDVEVIIINDGGDTPDFNFVENSRFNVVYLTMPENRGPGASRQTGIDYVLAQSKSDYILFIDSDDRLLSSNSLSIYQFYFTSYCNNHHCIPDILQPSEQIWEKFTDGTNSEIIQDKIEYVFDKANDYERIKEKLIGETFEYAPEFNYIINGILMRYENNPDLIRFLRENTGLIIATFSSNIHRRK